MALRKGMVIGVVALIVILLAFGGFMFLKNAAKQALNSNGTPNVAEKKDGLSFSSLQDVFTNKSLSLTCKFTDPNGRKTTSYIKGGRVRADIVGTSTTDSGSVIVTESSMHFWNGAKGMTLRFTEEQRAKMMEGTDPQTSQGQAALADLEKYKESCKTTVVSDSLFTPPTTVTFQDLSELMKAIPTGAGSGAVPSIDPEQYKKLIEQYQ